MQTSSLIHTNRGYLVGVVFLSFYLRTASRKNGHQRDTQAVHPSHWVEPLVEVKYYDDLRLEQQLARAAEQHVKLTHTLAQQCYY